MANPTTPAEAIAGRLLADDAAALAALVGDRIWPNKPTQDPACPYVTFFRSGGGDGVRLDGATSLNPAEVRVEAVAETQGEADAVMAAVAERLAGWRDRSIGVQGCFPAGDRDEQTNDDGRQVSGQSFTLWFKPQQ